MYFPIGNAQLIVRCASPYFSLLGYERRRRYGEENGDGMGDENGERDGDVERRKYS
jgi:hypothetical protein